ncbi:hypothetical protein SVAN01_11182 [Stagonosporopsis vannaccii]|nr:hypothetical protein SVAN01_11182 [Stagonosporopsis vannaccii]
MSKTFARTKQKLSSLSPRGSLKLRSQSSVSLLRHPACSLAKQPVVGRLPARVFQKRERQRAPGSYRQELIERPLVSIYTSGSSAMQERDATATALLSASVTRHVGGMPATPRGTCKDLQRPVTANEFLCNCRQALFTCLAQHNEAVLRVHKLLLTNFSCM